ncbi:MAG TPA: ComF family protein [Arenimonas sp.]|nr:ComF family protein [Arenimonas sp.]
MNLVDQTLKSLCNQLFPPRCVLCQNAGMREIDLCQACFEALPGSPEPMASDYGKVLAGFDYQSPIDELIQGYKFQQQLGYGRLLAKLSMPVFNIKERPLALIPVPLHTQRLRQRGFNQSLELAKYWGKQFGVPVLSKELIRHRATQVQSSLKAIERVSNVSGAFIASGTLPAHIALVDDVYTTGATCLAAADALIACGVQRVDVWCLARVV